MARRPAPAGQSRRPRRWKFRPRAASHGRQAVGEMSSNEANPRRVSRHSVSHAADNGRVAQASGH